LKIWSQTEAGIVKLRKFLARAGIAVAGLIAVLLLALLLDHSMCTKLPPTTGEFVVGRTTRVWRDAQQTALLAQTPDAPRELVAWIWFPARAESASAPRGDYFPFAWRTAVEQKRGKLISNLLTRDLSKVQVNSAREAAVSNTAQPFPVVFIRPGAAALTLEYSALAEDLASHGYVVVGFDAPYRSAVVVFPDGRVIQRDARNDVDMVSGVEQRARAQRLVTAWSADVEFAIDQLEHMRADVGDSLFGAMDLRRVGIVGHSLGGAVAAHFCSVDSRCKAGIDIDGDLQGSVGGIGRPFMFIIGDHEAVRPAGGHVIAEIDAVFSGLPRTARNLIRMNGANHFSFSDDGALLKIQVVRHVLEWVGIAELTGRRQIAATAYCVRTFFDAHLSGPDSHQVTIDSSAWPELREVSSAGGRAH
jgi:predicted dienelactone hydrolase